MRWPKARPEIVFHLAAQPLVRRSYRIRSKPGPPTSWVPRICSMPAGSAGDVRAIVVVTTDKCMRTRNGPGAIGKRPFGGHDPYSASKAATELVVGAIAGLSSRRHGACSLRRRGPGM